MCFSFVKGVRNVARYTISEREEKANETTKANDSTSPSDDVEGVPTGVARGVEINLQTGQMNLKTSHLQQLVSS